MVSYEGRRGGEGREGTEGYVIYGPERVGRGSRLPGGIGMGWDGMVSSLQGLGRSCKYP